MSAAAVSPGSLIDRDAYPVDAVGASARAALVEHCRAQLAANGACELPGFVTPEATARMVAESDTLAPVAHHAEGPITIYLDVADPQLPEDHPRRWLGRSSLAAVAYDRDYFLSRAAAAGLVPRRPIVPGFWSGRTSLVYQDLVVLQPRAGARP